MASEYEEDYHNAFAKTLTAAKTDRAILNSIRLLRPSDKDYTNLGDLIGKHPFTILDDKIFCTGKALGESDTLLEDIGGGMHPDFGLRAKSSANPSARIYIEIKHKAGATQAKGFNQYARYFVYLAATTLQNKDNPGIDFQRAMILAAPKEWFGSKYYKEWLVFRETFGPMANELKIVLAEIELPTIT